MRYLVVQYDSYHQRTYVVHFAEQAYDNAIDFAQMIQGQVKSKDDKTFIFEEPCNFYYH